MPAEGLTGCRRTEILTFEEIDRLLGIFVGLGVRSLKVTGGEPTVRADLPRWSGCSDGRARTSTSRSRRTASSWSGSPRRWPTPASTARRSRATRCSPPVRRDDPPRRVRPGARGPRGGRGGRAHADQDQLRRDRRHERRRGRRLRAVGARDRLRGPVHRIHAAGRRACVGAGEGGAVGRILEAIDAAFRSLAAHRASSPPPPTGSPTARRAASA